ncbi:hypothetical protein GCM10010253_50160 [Streptomyces badius]|uniref:Uncharacterized protein n=1 Tax=Streptomyces badius TaxID=1941 RepID=A0ABQ2THJ7_STRBA|nr:hypothetical protein GCM10010253_50160 [Streptomyces badius]
MRLAADGLLGLLVEEDHGTAGVDQFGGGHEPGESCPDHDHISVVRHGFHPVGEGRAGDKLPVRQILDTGRCHVNRPAAVG